MIWQGRATADCLSFTIGDDGRTLPAADGSDDACKVWMRRIGDDLLIDDYDHRGGMNVTCRDAYVRRR